MTLFKASRLPRPATPAYEYIRIPASPPASVARVEPSGSPRRAVSLPSGSLQVGLYNLGRFVRYCRSRAACRHEPIGSLPGRSWARRLEEVVGLCLALRSSLVPPGAPGASRPMVGAAAPSAAAATSRCWCTRAASPRWPRRPRPARWARTGSSTSATSPCCPASSTPMSTSPPLGWARTVPTCVAPAPPRTCSSGSRPRRGARAAYLSRVDGHQGLATLEVLGDAGALAAVGCDRGTDGVPTGVVRDDANHRARRHALGQLPKATLVAAQDQALALAARRGVVCVHEMGGPDVSSRRDFELLLGRLDALPLQVVCYWGAFDLEYVVDRKLSQVGGDLFLDGSLGSHSAALSTPYDDRPETRGSLYHDDAELTDLYVRATMAGIQVGVHAIGDRAIVQALRCARRAVRAVGHAAFDAAWGRPDGMYEHRLGSRRAKSMNPFADLWRRGVPMGGSSDSSVTPLNPWHGVAAAVHHHRASQRLGLPVALELFTLGGRVLARQERTTGRIHAGQRADLTAFPGDVLAVDPSKLEQVDAVFTMVGGRLAHGHEELAMDAAFSFGGWT